MCNDSRVIANIIFCFFAGRVVLASLLTDSRQPGERAPLALIVKPP